MPTRFARPSGPSSPIVGLASARSRRFAWLRPRYARLPALTAPSANLVRHLSTAPGERRPHQAARRFMNLPVKPFESVTER